MDLTDCGCDRRFEEYTVCKRLERAKGCPLHLRAGCSLARLIVYAMSKTKQSRGYMSVDPRKRRPTCTTDGWRALYI